VNRTSLAVTAVATLVALIACKGKTEKPEKREKPEPSAEVPSSEHAKATPTHTGSAKAPPPAKPETPAKGEATLVVQKVTRRSTCGSDVLGYDVLVESSADEGAKPARRPLFCPPAKKDMFGMCSHFRRCEVDSSEAPTSSRAAVTCDGKHFVLEATENGTHVSTPEDAGAATDVAPYRMHVAPPKTEGRTANVDC
jgi:hypothetical protein